MILVLAATMTRMFKSRDAPSIRRGYLLKQLGNCCKKQSCDCISEFIHWEYVEQHTLNVWSDSKILSLLWPSFVFHISSVWIRSKRQTFRNLFHSMNQNRGLKRHKSADPFGCRAELHHSMFCLVSELFHFTYIGTELKAEHKPKRILFREA